LSRHIALLNNGSGVTPGSTESSIYKAVPMNPRICLGDFVTLGQQLYYLANPNVQNVQAYFDEMHKFLASLLTCNLMRTHQVASPLANVTSIPYDLRTGLIASGGVAHFRAFMEPVHRSLYQEAAEREIVAINSGAVSQQLRQLPSQLTLNATQSRLRDETILCIESGAHRAAAVMGWNLAYDVIRQWIFDNHLIDVNAALATHTRRNGQPRYDPIVDYEDFFKGEPSEATVIEACFDAQKIRGSLRDSLRQHLRRRNDYAHRSFTQPTADQANAYLHDLLDIITSPPFR
jgi:hypothetical protein